MAVPTRTRVDRVLVERGLAESRERAQALLMAGRVFAAGQRIDKPGTLVGSETPLEVRGDPNPFVSRGGLKLDGVIDALAVDPTDRVCIDVGASTGGFTHVLLARGALRVHALDVGRAQLHERLRRDLRVVCHEGVNARHGILDIVGEPATLIVIDVSFISLTLILPSAFAALDARDPNACIVAMIKPQFELDRRAVRRGGVVRDDASRERAVHSVVDFASRLGLRASGRMESPVAGPAGNREIFVRFDRTSS